jgi:hypothetical protein
MHTRQYTEVSAARLLFDMPAFNHWERRPLNRQLKQLIAELDEQTLMSLAAHAVTQITSGLKPARRLPI